MHYSSYSTNKNTIYNTFSDIKLVHVKIKLRMDIMELVCANSIKVKINNKKKGKALK